MGFCTLLLVYPLLGITMSLLVFAVTLWRPLTTCFLIVPWLVVGLTGSSLLSMWLLLWLPVFLFVTCFLASALQNFSAYPVFLHICYVCKFVIWTPLKDKCFRCGSADHLARNCTNAWNLDPPLPATPDPHPPAAAVPHPSAPSQDPVPPAPQEAALGVSTHPPSSPAVPQVPVQQPPLQQQPPLSEQCSLLAGLPLVPDSPLLCPGMPSLEELPGGGTAPSPAGVLDQHGFLTEHSPHPGVSAVDPTLSSSGASAHVSICSLVNVENQMSPSKPDVGNQRSSVKSNVGNQRSSAKLNVGDQKSSTQSNVGSQRNSTNSKEGSQRSSINSKEGSQKTSASINVEGQGSPSLSYSGVVSHSCSQISNSVPNSNAAQNSSQIPDIQITGSNSVPPVDSEMVNVDRPSDDLTPRDIVSLRKVASPAHASVKRIGLGRLPGDQGLKSRTKKHK